MRIVKGPDFPTGGTILGENAIREAYKTGRGSIAIRGKAEIIEEKGKFKILITEIPYQVYKGRIVEAIAEAHAEKRIQGITRLDDESNRKGMRVVVELHRSATPKVVLNQLYKHTPLQSSFGFNMLAWSRWSAARRRYGRDRTAVLTLKLIEFFIRTAATSSPSAPYELRSEERAHPPKVTDRARQHRRGHRDARGAKPRRVRPAGALPASDIQPRRSRRARARRHGTPEDEDEYAELIKLIAELSILRSRRRARDRQRRDARPQERSRRTAPDRPPKAMR